MILLLTFSGPQRRHFTLLFNVLSIKQNKCESSQTFKTVITHLDYIDIQLHNLESILGDLRGSTSDFYPDQAGGGGANDTGGKAQGCLDDSLRGECKDYEKRWVS